MASENELKHYIKLLIKEYESDVLSDDRYRDGRLDPGFIHQEYNVAVDKYLKTVTALEAKDIKETERLYYRGWISSYLSMMLSLERQERFDRETEAMGKQREKLEKEIERLRDKNVKLEAKLAARAEKTKKK